MKVYEYLAYLEPRKDFSTLDKVCHYCQSIRYNACMLNNEYNIFSEEVMDKICEQTCVTYGSSECSTCTRVFLDMDRE